MDKNRKSIFDELEDDLSENNGSGYHDSPTSDYSDYDHKMAEEYEKILGVSCGNFQPEVYHNRGFIKDGEFVSNVEETLGVHGDSLQTYVDWVSMSICSEDCLVTIFTKEPADIEKTLLAVLTSSKYFNEESRTEIGEQCRIYVFCPFDNKTACEVTLPKDLKGFMGEYTFIKTLRGWTLLNFNRVIALPIKKGE